MFFNMISKFINPFTEIINIISIFHVRPKIYTQNMSYVVTWIYRYRIQSNYNIYISIFLVRIIRISVDILIFKYFIETSSLPSPEKPRFAKAVKQSQKSLYFSDFPLNFVLFFYFIVATNNPSFKSPTYLINCFFPIPLSEMSMQSLKSLNLINFQTFSDF